MTTYEYKALNADNLPSPEQLTNDFGKLGWKVIQILPTGDGTYLIYFIRELEPTK